MVSSTSEGVGASGERLSLPDTASGEESMGKDTAMLLTFLYAAFAWTMSNGLLLNPHTQPTH